MIPLTKLIARLREETSRQINPKALGVFTLLWDNLPADAKTPVLSVTPDGDIVAEWYKNLNENFTLLVDDSGQAYYILSCYNTDIMTFEGTLADVRNVATIQEVLGVKVFSWSDYTEAS